MKKYIFIALLATAAIDTNAQKLEKPRIDKITGDTTLVTKEETICNPFRIVAHYLAVNVLKTKDFSLLYFHSKEGIQMFYSVFKGDKAIIKFTDGKLLELTAPLDEHSSLIGSGLSAGTEGSIPYDLTEEDIAALKNGKISVIRIYTSKEAFDYDISDGKSEVIKKQLELFIKK